MKQVLSAVLSLVLVAIPLLLVPGTAQATVASKPDAPVSMQPALGTPNNSVHVGLRPLVSGARSVSTTTPGPDRPHTKPAHLIRRPISKSSAVQNSVFGTSNWAGVVETGATYTGIEGQWNVPAISPSSSDKYSASWLGIDGVDDSSLIQTGTGQQVIGGGVVSYDAWIELLPAGPQVIAATVNPGDEMQAVIEETSTNVWTMTIEDVTQNWVYSNPFNYVTPGHSAEWIEEAPEVNGSQSTLANFNKVTFNQVSITGSNLSSSVGDLDVILDSSGAIAAYPGNFAAGSFEVFYGEPPPVVGSISPSQGSTNGGTLVTISGIAFRHTTAVYFGNHTANFSIVNDSTIQTTAPPDVAGPTDITVSNPEGLSLTSSADQFTYVAPATPTPTVSPVSNNGLLPPVVGIAALPSGTGYWLANAQGEVSAHGDAVNYGSMTGHRLNAPISHIVATADGKGYWLIASDGGTFAFGDAGYFGSMGGQHLNAPVVDMTPTSDDNGYWLVASDGGIFAFGDAQFHGSMGGTHLNRSYGH